MDIESPEAAEVLISGIDANARALKDLIRIVKGLKTEVGALRQKVQGLEEMMKRSEK